MNEYAIIDNRTNEIIAVNIPYGMTTDFILKLATQQDCSTSAFTRMNMVILNKLVMNYRK